MTIQIDPKQPSSKRGLVWLVLGVVGIIGWWFEKDLEPLVYLASAVAGGMGLLMKD